jgi:hypothetical protein
MHRILAHVKTFARWIHHVHLFPRGNLMDMLMLPLLGPRLAIG